jgi:hypothetical protein
MKSVKCPLLQRQTGHAQCWLCPPDPNSAGGRGLQDRAPAVNRATKTGDQCKAERIAIVVPRISADLAPLKTLLPVPPFPAYLYRAEFPA